MSTWKINIIEYTCITNLIFFLNLCTLIMKAENTRAAEYLVYLFVIDTNTVTLADRHRFKTFMKGFEMSFLVYS